MWFHGHYPIYQWKEDRKWVDGGWRIEYGAGRRNPRQYSGAKRNISPPIISNGWQWMVQNL